MAKQRGRPKKPAEGLVSGLPNQPEIKAGYNMLVKLRSGEEYHGNGTTLLEAIEQIKIAGFVKTLGSVVASFGDKKVEKMMPAGKLQRIFGTKAMGSIKRIAQSNCAKYLNSGLK